MCVVNLFWVSLDFENFFGRDWLVLSVSVVHWAHFVGASAVGVIVVGVILVTAPAIGVILIFFVGFVLYSYSDEVVGEVVLSFGQIFILES